MIKTEAKRGTIVSCEQRAPPSDVLEAMRRYDSALDLIWNADQYQWEIYRIKQKGVTPTDDLMHWQMSAPEKGTGITVGIIDWLRKFDTSPNGIFTVEEIQKKWVGRFKIIQENEQLRFDKKIEDISYGFQHFINDVAVQRTRVVVPRAVGYNKKTGKRIYAVPRKKVSIGK